MEAKDSDNSIVDQYFHELDQLARATIKTDPAGIAGAAAALLLKLMTGSSLAAGAAETAVAGAFGRWFADTPDTRFTTAVAAYETNRNKHAQMHAVVEAIRGPILRATAEASQLVTSVRDGQLRLAADQSDANDTLAHAMWQALDGIEHLELQSRQLAELVRRVDAALGERVASTARPGLRVPLQLPPLALGGQLFGRTAEREALRARLERGESAALVGPAGWGKTALAAAVVRDIVGAHGEYLSTSPFPDGVIFLDLYRLRAQPHLAQTQLADALIGHALSEKPAYERAREACRNRRLLAILEGAELADGSDGHADLAQLLQVLDPRSRYLVLTRDLRQALPGSTVKLDQALTPSDAAELLDRLAGPLPVDARSRVLELAQGHPLALTWAGGLLARGDEDPTYLIDGWSNGRLPSLSDPDPSHQTHTLAWLFERSVNVLSANERLCLSALGQFANLTYSLDAVQSFDADIDVRGCLMRLVQSGLLRLAARREHWQFTHVLAYQFARELSVSDEVLALGADWLRVQLKAAEEGAESAGGHDLLTHAESVLRKDHAQLLWPLLGSHILHSTHQHAYRLGRLELATLALDAVCHWLDHRTQHGIAAEEHSRERAEWLYLRGKTTRALGDYRAAHETFQSCRELWTSIVARDQDVGARASLSRCCDRLGEPQLEDGDLQAAAGSFEQSRELRDALVASNPRHWEWYAALGTSLNYLSRTRLAMGDLVAAERCSQRELEIARKVLAVQPDEFQPQRGMFWAVERLSQIQEAAGDIAGAAQSIDECVARAESLLQRWPRGPGRRRDLAFVLGRRGEVRMKHGNWLEAAADFERIRMIYSDLAQEHPHNLQWQRALGASLVSLANNAFVRGLRQDARARASAGLLVAQQVFQAEPTRSEYVEELRARQELVQRLEALDEAGADYRA